MTNGSAESLGLERDGGVTARLSVSRKAGAVPADSGGGESRSSRATWFTRDTSLPWLESTGWLPDSTRSSDRFKLSRRPLAAFIISSLRRLITPSVRCRTPKGRKAFSGITAFVVDAVASASSSAGASNLAGRVTDCLKSDRDSCICGIEVVVRSGRQRKCVNRGFLLLYFRLAIGHRSRR